MYEVTEEQNGLAFKNGFCKFQNVFVWIFHSIPSKKCEETDFVKEERNLLGHVVDTILRTFGL